jgi:hypothetical protein
VESSFFFPLMEALFSFPAQSIGGIHMDFDYSSVGVISLSETSELVSMNCVK